MCNNLYSDCSVIAKISKNAGSNYLNCKQGYLTCLLFKNIVESLSILISHLNQQESERKAYNPRSFCKVYQMDHQPLNTGEQKDMAEFFIDLVSKLEEMTPELKKLVKTLFCGVLSNNVVSLVSYISLHIIPRDSRSDCSIEPRNLRSIFRLTGFL